VQDAFLAVVTHRDDEGEAVALAVRGVERTEAHHFVARQAIQTRARLLRNRVVGHRAFLRFPAGELRVRPQQGQLLGARCGLHGCRHRGVKRIDRHEGSRIEATLGHPRRMLENAPECGDELGAVHPVGIIQVHVRLLLCDGRILGAPDGKKRGRLLYWV